MVGQISRENTARSECEPAQYNMSRTPLAFVRLNSVTTLKTPRSTLIIDCQILRLRNTINDGYGRLRYFEMYVTCISTTVCVQCDVCVKCVSVCVSSVSVYVSLCVRRQCVCVCPVSVCVHECVLCSY